jgi:hypothetical protein
MSREGAASPGIRCHQAEASGEDYDALATLSTNEEES